MHAYQVLRATVAKFEEMCLKLFEQYAVVIETCGCDGNDVIHVIRMCTKFNRYS